MITGKQKPIPLHPCGIGTLLRSERCRSTSGRLDTCVANRFESSKPIKGCGTEVTWIGWSFLAALSGGTIPRFSIPVEDAQPWDT
jgi:hypothetical protein